MTVGQIMGDQNITGGVSNQKEPWIDIMDPISTPSTCYYAAGPDAHITLLEQDDLCLGAFCDTTNSFEQTGSSAPSCVATVQLQFRCGQY